tara:strand:+ start:124 stop:879 length:756 start_codon:yes stop_codon:yes gene_type:complete
MKYKKLEKEWEFNVLGVDNFRISGKLSNYYQFIRDNHQSIPGDICEVGVFRGSSLLATAMLLQELGSDKIVWGFDSFEGFPQYHENDKLEKFDDLHKSGSISSAMYEDVKKNQEFKSFMSKRDIDVTNISTSGDFSDTSYEFLMEKIEYFGLENIRLVKGDFADTMKSTAEDPDSFMAGLIDCDLYLGYQVSLPYVWERLSKGGYLYLDEYYSLKFAGARIATDEFFTDQEQKPEQHPIVTGAFERWFVTK